MRRVKVKLCLVILGILVIVGIMVIKLNGYENSRYKQNRSNQGKCIANIESSKESNNSGYRVDYVNDEAYLLNNGEKVEIVKSLEKYKDISEIYYECFAIVKNDKESYGVIDSNGNEIIPVEYTNIDFDVLYSENWYGSHVVFKLKKDDGYDIMEINFND